MKNHLLPMKKVNIGVVEILKILEMYSNQLVKNFGLIVAIAITHLKVNYLILLKENGVHFVVITDYVINKNVKLVMKNHLLHMKKVNFGARKILKNHKTFSNQVIKNFGLTALIVIIHLIVH